MTFKVNQYSEIGSLPDVVRDFVVAHHGSFDKSLFWYSAFADQIVQNSDMAVNVHVLSNGDSICGVWPLLDESVRFGRQMGSMSNFYTAYCDPIIDPSLDYAEIIKEMLRPLVSGRYCQLDFGPILRDGQFRALIGALEELGCYTEPYFKFANWVYACGEMSFVEYFQQRPGKLKSTIKRKTKKIEKDPTFELKLLSDPEAVDSAMSDYEAVYALSWKQSEPYPQFIRQFVQHASRQGWVKLGVVYLEGKPVASQLWFVKDKVASIFKLAYDPAYRATSAGSVLSGKLFESVIDDDSVEIIDYLTGDDAYKRDWMSERRQLWGVRAYPRRSLIGRVKAILAAAKGSLRRRIKKQADD